MVSCAVRSCCCRNAVENKKSSGITFHNFITKSVSTLVGLTICGMSGYLLYIFFRKEDDLGDPYPQISKFKTFKMKVPKNVVHILIGRNGKNIKQIQEQSNTRINFKDQDGSEDTVCIIRGSSESCNVAESLILDFINNQPVLESQDLWVPVVYIGAVIGRCGEKINEIRCLSGAKLTVNDEEHNVKGKRLTIKGTAEQICVAKSLIEDTIDHIKQSRQTLENALSRRKPRISSKSSDNLKTSDCKVEPVPEHPDTQFEVYVSAMVDPSRFWLQIVGPKATELDCLVEEMTEYYSKEENRKLHTLDHINKGDLVAAIFQTDNKWYRAEILNLKEDHSEKTAELYYVDYGDTDDLPCTDLYELRTDFLRLHFQAIECFLQRIDPIGEEWSEAAIDKFEELAQVAQWKKLLAKVNGYSTREKTRAKREGSPIPGVDLYKINNQNDVNIAEELVKAGLAVFKESNDIQITNSNTTSISNLSVISSS